jgi:hypothetical protein
MELCIFQRKKNIKRGFEAGDLGWKCNNNLTKRKKGLK